MSSHPLHLRALPWQLLDNDDFPPFVLFELGRHPKPCKHPFWLTPCVYFPTATYACAVLPTTRHSTVQRHLSPEEQGLSLTNLTVNLPGRPNEALCQDLSLRLDPGVQMHRNRGVALVYSALSQDRSCKSSACTWTQ
eukprot:1160206-Pelagomonas_calceolata.AAC.1